MKLGSRSVIGVSISVALLATMAAPSAVVALPDRSPSVTIPIETVNSSLAPGFNGVVTIRVGNSEPFRVMLDTGSVGLMLFPNAPQRGITKKAVTSTLPNGDSVTGKQGRAVLAIGRAKTTTAVDFHFISSTNPWITGWQNQNVMGILGVGLKSASIPNPLRAMPRAIAQTWSIHFDRTGPGELILGDDIPPAALMHFPLKPEVGTKPGDKFWNDHAAPGCWTFDTLRVNNPKRSREYCVNTWFDSGFPIMRIKGREFDRLQLTSTKALRPGTLVRLAAGSSAFAPAQFRAGVTGSRNTTRVIPEGRSEINTGNSFYFSHRVFYNIPTGDIYLDKPQSKVGN